MKISAQPIIFQGSLKIKGTESLLSKGPAGHPLKTTRLNASFCSGQFCHPRLEVQNAKRKKKYKEKTRERKKERVSPKIKIKVKKNN